MIPIIIPVLGRPSFLARTLERIQQTTPEPRRVLVAVDGEPDVDWHQVARNTHIARAAGAEVHVLGAWRGNGGAFEAARAAAGTGPLVKVDADMLLPDEWLVTMLAEADAHDDGLLGAVVARVHPQSHAPAGRVAPPHVPGFGVALLTARGNVAILDHTTTIPVGGHDVLIACALDTAGLWIWQSDRVSVLDHLGDRHLPSDPYGQWKRAYLPTVPPRTCA